MVFLSICPMFAHCTQAVHLTYAGHGHEQPDSAAAESAITALCSCPLLEELKLLSFFMWCAYCLLRTDPKQTWAPTAAGCSAAQQLLTSACFGCQFRHAHASFPQIDGAL